MAKSTVLFFFVLLSFTLIVSCEKERNLGDYSDEEFVTITQDLTLPKVVHNYELHLGEHFLPPGKTFPQINTLSLAEIQSNNNKATLGRVIFYDQSLSIDGKVSCASCHKPELAFADDKRKSKGVNDISTKRNALALATTLSFKISYNPFDASQSRSKFSWDDASPTLDVQVRNAFRIENQMGINDEELFNRIKSKPYYDILFTKAFGENEVNGERIGQAVEAFINAISSVNSKFDRGLEGAQAFSEESPFPNFTAEENLGKTIYNKNCAVCHSPKHNFTVKSSANNGLGLVYKDKGIGGRINDPKLFGVFKVPFLRNIGLTGPYMHDGRFETLREVVDHYSDGVQAHPNLSPELKDASGNPKRLHLNDEEKDALVTYLKTLSDFSFQYDDRFTNPFKN